MARGGEAAGLRLEGGVRTALRASPCLQSQKCLTFSPRRLQLLCIDWRKFDSEKGE